MSSHFTGILNIFIKYFNQREGTTQNLFEGIDLMEDSNDMMDEFFEHIDAFKQSSEITRRLYNPSEITISGFEELYALRVDDNIVCLSELLLPILNFMSEHIQWVDKNWQIVCIQNSQ